MPPIIPDHFAAFLARVPGGTAINAASQAAGAPDLTGQAKDAMNYLHAYLFFPQPRWLTDLRATEKGNRWYSRLVSGIFDNVQSARQAVEYHLKSIERIEANVSDALGGCDFSDIPPGTVVGVGNTKTLEFEYHAYVFAYRRALEYLARAIAGYFRTDCNSYKDLESAISNRHGGSIVTQRVLAACQKYSDELAFVISIGNDHHSVRDVLTHYEFVPVGCFNISRYGFRLFGTTESLISEGMVTTLTEALQMRMLTLDALLADVIRTFTDAVRDEQDELERNSTAEGGQSMQG